MDCEKFDQVLIDALYEELDELTLAAARRHTDACQRCRAAWSGLRATRKIGILPLVEAPAGLEARILEAARDAHRNVPWPKRLGRAVSWAGSYAMRPQTAMAALLVLMLGSSVIFLRVKPDRSGAPSRVSVTERGVPEQAADELHAEKQAPRARAAKAPRSGRAEEDRFAVPPAPREPSLDSLGDTRSKGMADRGNAETQGEPGVGAPARRAAGPEAESAEDRAGGAFDRDAKEKKKAEIPGAPPPLAEPAATVAGASQGKDTYSAAMDLYAAGRFGEAEKALNEVAASGSKNAAWAALYAAKSAEAGVGCGKAAPKYEAVASRYGGSSAGAEALWGAANCYKSIGHFERARVLFNELRSVAGYRDRAEAELENLKILQQQQVASSREKARQAPPAKPSSNFATKQQLPLLEPAKK